jgi:DNA repair exonuclease SbcCD ATPase subunit
MTQSNIPTDIRDRILQVASELYEQTDREKLPTVDEVRRAARADMNTTSVVMREWRKQQTRQTAPVAVAIPAPVQDAFQAALAAAWVQAQGLASEALAAAQKGWDEERAAADELRGEMAEAFEVQARELEATAGQLEQAKRAQQACEKELQSSRQQVEDVSRQCQELATNLATAERQAQDRGERIDELKAELAEARTEIKDHRKDAECERKALATELAGAREGNATLTGELGVLREQLAELKRGGGSVSD